MSQVEKFATETGAAVLNGPLTTAATRELSPDLLKNELDNRVVKIRPMSTPIDQISRWSGTRKAGSMIVDFYSVDTKPIEAKLLNLSAGRGETTQAKMETDNDKIFQVSETILVPEVKVTNREGKEESLILYIVSVSSEGIQVVSVNNYDTGTQKMVIPEVSAGAKLIRMGKAATELDVQTSQFEALPIKSQNYCQIFKAQVEQSTFQKIADKEVGWTFTDQEEVAIIDYYCPLKK